ncbi:MAG: hypothetical protein ACT4O5_03765, partial [Gammaproteobacteria bacterium]
MIEGSFIGSVALQSAAAGGRSSGVFDGSGKKPAPTPEELQRLIETIAEQIGRALERTGLLVRDAEQAYLTGES